MYAAQVLGSWKGRAVRMPARSTFLCSEEVFGVTNHGMTPKILIDLFCAVKRLEGIVWGTEDRAIEKNPRILSIRTVEPGTEPRPACWFNVVAHACNDGMLSVHRYCLRTAAEMPPHIRLG
jgi:hypothetical protein